MDNTTNTRQPASSDFMADPLSLADSHPIGQSRTAGSDFDSIDLPQAFKRMIVSASGWRKVFAISGNEDDDTPEVCPSDRFLAGAAALAYARSLAPHATVLVGTDARPTGPLLATIANRIFTACGLKVIYLAVISAPAIMAASTQTGIDGFFYISASHNPIGHNGFKFGHDGGVAPGSESAEIARTFAAFAQKPDTVHELASLSAQVASDICKRIIEDMQENRMRALAAYEHLVEMTLADSSDPSTIEKSVRRLATCVEKRPLGILGELNGSARGNGIDGTFLARLGIRTRFVHAIPGQIVHGIVPEGDNLELCRTLLEQAHREDPAFLLGYVPDNDGDRGNIAWIDEHSGRASILGAQELFALVAAVELSHPSADQPRKAVAVNCPTSLMIETIASALGASVARAEVGEANVVSLAEHLRTQGNQVRILGEGSNGGNITHPGKVRDPLNTLVSLAKLLTDPEIFSRTASACSPARQPQWSMSGALGMLPPRTMTPSFSKDAIMHIKCTDHNLLKQAYEALFLADLDSNRRLLEERFGIHGWREEQTEGICCRIGMGSAFRSAQGKGGLKIVFLDNDKNPTDFIWMRGSGTEPVFRIMADAKGDDPERHAYLLAWQRSLVQRADQIATSGS